MAIQSLRGFEDILPSQSAKWQAIERIARETAELFHFAEIRTPILESADVYHRGVGETNDMVKKETYSFADRDGEMVTLRPEGTAGVVRAVIEAGLLNDQGARAKVYYLGSNFRHERPQKGRLRQHHQFGVEAFGVASPEQDVECIQLQMEFYRRCGLKELALNINSLGDRDSKEAYRKVLVDFLSPKKDHLSEDSQRRLEQNPLRILDSKDPRDKSACEGAPSAIDSLSEKSRAHFDKVVELLNQTGLKYQIDPKLVRGFDYYTETLWEATAGGLGSQNAVGGGGRYDNLVEQLGGRPTPGVGFGSGLERLLIALDAQGVQIPLNQKPLVFLAAHGDAARLHNSRLAIDLRTAGIAVDQDLAGRAIKAQFKMAEKENARFTITVGDSELQNNTVVLKDFQTREQVTVARDQIVAVVSERLK